MFRTRVAEKDVANSSCQFYFFFYVDLNVLEINGEEKPEFSLGVSLS